MDQGEGEGEGWFCAKVVEGFTRCMWQDHVQEMQETGPGAGVERENSGADDKSMFRRLRSVLQVQRSGQVC